jgi:hypothetical protein
VVEIAPLEPDAVDPAPDEATPLGCLEHIAGVLLAVSASEMLDAFRIGEQEADVEAVQADAHDRRMGQPDDVPGDPAPTGDPAPRGEHHRPSNREHEDHSGHQASTSNQLSFAGQPVTANSANDLARVGSVSGQR